MRGMLYVSGIEIDSISIGANPSLVKLDILERITEIRSGTYIFMDAGQGNALGDFSN